MTRYCTRRKLRRGVLGRNQLRGDPARSLRRAAPTSGQDDQCILESILGYGETRISELVFRWNSVGLLNPGSFARRT